MVLKNTIINSDYKNCSQLVSEKNEQWDRFIKENKIAGNFIAVLIFKPC